MVRKSKTGRSTPALRTAASIDPTQIVGRILLINGVRVILDADLAGFYDTTTAAVNQYRARNEDRFTPDYAFQLTENEWEDLRSQDVISSSHGGRRFRPWAYTEHGVAMMSMGMKSETAIRLSKVIISTFVEFRRGTLTKDKVISGPNALRHRRALAEQIYATMTQLMKLPVTSEETLGDALGKIATRAMGSVKALLDAPGLKNDKLSAETARILAEAEKVYAETRRIHEETNSIALKNKREALALLRDLRDMASQLERDDWVEVMDQSFGQSETARRLQKPKADAD
jgi:hypothetical protein